MGLSDGCSHCCMFEFYIKYGYIQRVAMPSAPFERSGLAGEECMYYAMPPTLFHYSPTQESSKTRKLSNLE